MFDLISIGDATLDTFIEIDEATVHCTLQEGACQLCFNYADKIPIKSLAQKVAGNAANVAVGASRLGMRTAFYSIVGNDTIGKDILATIRKEKVSSKYIQQEKDKKSNYSVVLNFKGERTILVYHYPRKYHLPQLSKMTKWIYLTSMAKDSQKVGLEVVSFVRANGTKLAFNPGTYQIRFGLSYLKKIFSVTEILFANKEEAQKILESNEQNVKNLMKNLAQLGISVVVITDGKNGAYAFDGNTSYFSEIFPSPMIERTGAGDSFATAFMAARFYGKSIAEALAWGTFNSASVIGKIGPQDGLLTLNEMVKKLKKNSKFVGKKV